MAIFVLQPLLPITTTVIWINSQGYFSTTAKIKIWIPIPATAVLAVLSPSLCCSLSLRCVGEQTVSSCAQLSVSFYDAFLIVAVLKVRFTTITGVSHVSQLSGNYGWRTWLHSRPISSSITPNRPSRHWLDSDGQCLNKINWVSALSHDC